MLFSAGRVPELVSRPLLTQAPDNTRVQPRPFTPEDDLHDSLEESHGDGTGFYSFPISWRLHKY